jgi:Recombination, repair and ssDNA binding protein UvsY
MLTNEELMKSWETDCKIDRTDLLSTMYSHPILHSKYLTYLQDYKLGLRKIMMKYQELRLLRQRYFNGELTKEILDSKGWDQYLVKRPLKSEMEALLDASPDLQLLQEKSLYIESLIQSCESILKDINSRYFLFKNLVEYEKFQAGV